MRKKYIIEIPDEKIGDFVGSTHFLMPYMMAGHIGHHDTGLLITPYTEPDMEQVRKEAYENAYETIKHECKDCRKIRADVEQELADKVYQKGLSDAWEAARKIASDKVGWNYSIFGQHFTVEILNTHSASEAIEKIRAYEQEKKKRIQVGDEVNAPFGKAIVVNIDFDAEKIWLVYADGHGGFEYFKDAPTKTGRHFPEITEVLEKMKEKS